MFLMDILDGTPEAPKRGDLLQTNLGDRRERTWLVLYARRVRRRSQDGRPLRYEMHAARWWEIEPETRMALFRSAERRGGQRVWHFERYGQQKKPTFEDLMRTTRR